MKPRFTRGFLLTNNFSLLELCQRNTLKDGGYAYMRITICEDMDFYLAPIQKAIQH